MFRKCFYLIRFINFSRVRVARFLVLCLMFCRSSFVIFHLAIVLSALLRFATTDYLPLVSSNYSSNLHVHGHTLFMLNYTPSMCCVQQTSSFDESINHYIFKFLLNVVLRARARGVIRFNNHLVPEFPYVIVGLGWLNE